MPGTQVQGILRQSLPHPQGHAHGHCASSFEDYARCETHDGTQDSDARIMYQINVLLVEKRNTHTTTLSNCKLSETWRIEW